MLLKRKLMRTNQFAETCVSTARTGAANPHENVLGLPLAEPNSRVSYLDTGADAV
jgi:hypothetical protein